MDHRLNWTVFLVKFKKKKRFIDKHNKIKIYSSDFEFPLHAKSPKPQINHMYIENS